MRRICIQFTRRPIVQTKTPGVLPGAFQPVPQPCAASDQSA
jgi:hypothetical protein